jgi:hypothetical protein
VSAPLVTPLQIWAIAACFPLKAVYISQVAPFDKLPVPKGTVWVGAENEPAGVVLLPDGSEDQS